MTTESDINTLIYSINDNEAFNSLEQILKNVELFKIQVKQVD